LRLSRLRGGRVALGSSRRRSFDMRMGPWCRRPAP
jgi:hypothetical protein